MRTPELQQALNDFDDMVSDDLDILKGTVDPDFIDLLKLNLQRGSRSLVKTALGESYPSAEEMCKRLKIYGGSK